MRPNTSSLVGRTILERDVLHIADVAAEPMTPTPQLNKRSAFARISVCQCCGTETRSVLSVCSVGKSDFSSDRQIELVKAFADQAVIAIENARLLTDLNKLNQQLEQRVTDQVSEIERMGRLRRFLPPQVADLIVTSGQEATRKPPPRNYSTVLRSARLYRLLCKL